MGRALLTAYPDYVGAIGEHLVCAELFRYGVHAMLVPHETRSDIDIVARVPDYGLVGVQVKTTRCTHARGRSRKELRKRKPPKERAWVETRYKWNMKCSSKNIDVFAYVVLDQPFIFFERVVPERHDLHARSISTASFAQQAPGSLGRVLFSLRGYAVHELEFMD